METTARDLALFTALKPFLRPKAQALVEALVQTASKQAEFQTSGPLQTSFLIEDIQEEIAQAKDRLTTLVLLWFPLWITSGTATGGSAPIAELKQTTERNQLLTNDFLTWFTLTVAFANMLP
ncbi:MAG TPA: hypothetical protein GXX40_08860 [Firmicutes bacterium]|nr:hypothetical protein [Bacillota bacterium]